MKSILAYVLAVFLVLLTIPMYRYIIAQATAPHVDQVIRSRISHAAEDPAVQVIKALQSQNEVAMRRLVLQAKASAHGMEAPDLGRHLLPNERCVGGSVMRVDVIKGVRTYTQEAPDGVHPLMCPE